MIARRNINVCGRNPSRTKCLLNVSMAIIEFHKEMKTATWSHDATTPFTVPSEGSDPSTSALSFTVI